LRRSKIVALTRKDLQVMFSYRAEFLMRFAGILFTVSLWYFLSRLLEPSHPGYFEYVIVGIAIQGFLTTLLYGTAGRMREEQVTGTLESVLATPTPPSYLLFGGTLADMLNASINAAAFIFLAAFLGGFTIDTGSWIGLILGLLLTATTFAALGSLSASAVILFQKGNPFNFLITTMQALLGTVFFPVDILPPWLQSTAEWMPMTRALHILRGCFLNGMAFSEVIPDLLYLLLFTVVFSCIGMALFNASINRARREGSLGRF